MMLVSLLKLGRLEVICFVLERPDWLHHSASAGRYSANVVRSVQDQTAE